MLKDIASLWIPLTLSVSLHAGGIALMEAYYGAPESSTMPPAGRARAQMSVRLLAAELSSAPSTGHGFHATGSGALPQGAISLPGPYYFPPEELSRKPQAALPVPLQYPEDAPPVRNRVVLRLFISETGDVDRVLVETANVPAELERLARQAFAQARFQPGQRGNVAVKSQMLVEISFEGENLPPQPAALLPVR